MTRLSAVELMLLAAWLGAAILVATVVAPAAFRVLPSRTVAGAVIGQILPVLFIAGLTVALLSVVIEMRTTRDWLRPAVSGPLMLIIVGCGIAQFQIAPRIETVRASITGPVDGLPESDPRRVQFGKLHGLSVMCMGVAMFGAGAAIGRKLFTMSS